MTNQAPPAPPQAVLRAQRALSGRLHLPYDRVDIISFDPVEWPDSCLGMSSDDEMCAEVITPGWLVVLSAAGRRYEARTDASGEVVRLKT